MSLSQRIAENRRSFRIATWLGWQIESNWTDPFLFAIYSIAKPIAGALILVFMYMVIAEGGIQNPLFPMIFVGNAFYIYVGMVLMGVSWVVIDDREHYGMLKYIYTSPISIYWYLLGRGVAKTVIATVSVIMTLALGILLFSVPINLSTIDWPLFVIALILGLITLAFMGIFLGGISLLTARHNYFIGEAVAGALYVLCGAVFPIDILPKPFQILAQAFPLTYWLETLRRALLGSGASDILSGISNLQLLGILVGSTVAMIFVSIYFYRWAENRAKEKGKIDMQTMY